MGDVLMILACILSGLLFGLTFTSYGRRIIDRMLFTVLIIICVFNAIMGNKE